MEKMRVVVTAVVAVFVLLGCAVPASPGQDRIGETGAVTEAEVAPADQFPIVEEPITLTALVQPGSHIMDYNDNEFTRWIEETTNIKLVVDVAPFGAAEAEQKLNLVLASGDLPDLIIGFTTLSPDKQQILADQGLIVPINDLIEQYGANTKAVFAEMPQARDAVTLLDGNIYSIPDVNECYHCTHAQKMWVYQPWLEKLGLEIPETTDEFYAMLKAFKTQDPNGNGVADEIPLTGGQSWHTQLDRFLMNPFVYNSGFEPRHLYLEDGEIVASFVQPGWKEGLAYLRQLYAEGLIDPQAFTNSEDQMKALGENPNEVILGAAAAGHMGIFVQVFGPSARWEGYVPIPPLMGPGGLRQNPTTRNVVASGRFLITRNNSNPAASFRLADLMLSEEATHRSILGRLGIDWDWTEPGEAVSIGGGDAKYKVINRLNIDNNIGWGQSMPSYRPAYIREGEADTPDQPYEGMLHQWSKENYALYDVDMTIPPLIISPDQAQELGELRAIIYSIVDESFAAFVSGQMDIDQNWDAYLAQLEDAGLDRMLAIYQNAYDAKYK